MILLYVNCKESNAVIKLQMAYTWVSIKNREKTIVRASDKVQEKLKLCGIFFGKMEMIRF